MSKREHRRFTADQKLEILKEADQPGVTMSEVCRRIRRRFHRRTDLRPPPSVGLTNNWLSHTSPTTLSPKYTAASPNMRRDEISPRPAQLFAHVSHEFFIRRHARLPERRVCPLS